MYNEIDLDSIDLTTAPPTEEPGRQYYFIAKCRHYVKEFEQKHGQHPTFFIQTFGCQMNARDSEKLKGILGQIGYEESDNEESDFVLYNTCTVRENANNKVYGRLGTLSTHKKKNPNMMIALCGCMMQEPQVVEKLQKSYRFVNLIFGTHNIFKFAELLYTCLESDSMIIDVWKDTDKIVEELPMKRKFAFKSGVNIMFGCNNFCSYCIVPYVRGRERSREPRAIIREIEKLVEDGVCEIMLLGQNVNSYGKNLDNSISFAELLREVDKIEGLERIRFMTSHPKDLSDDLIAAIRDCRKVCHHLHLPLQSGSSRILKAMNRSYDKERYLDLVRKLREAVPDITLTTDIIVGFPGETEEDFLDTLDVVEQVRYDSAFTFIYSKRTGTPAASMENQVPEDIIKDRFDRLLARVQQIGAQRAERFTGQTLPVLVEELNTHGGDLRPPQTHEGEVLLNGRLDNNSVVHFYGTSDMIGKIYPIWLQECKGFYYFGEQVR